MLVINIQSHIEYVAITFVTNVISYTVNVIFLMCWLYWVENIWKFTNFIYLWV